MNKPEVTLELVAVSRINDFYGRKIKEYNMVKWLFHSICERKE
jgi:hypothetical protein